MPSIDKRTGKRLSGHAQRKKTEAANKDRMSPTALAEFKAIGPPPLDEPDLIFTWSRKKLAVAIDLLCRDQLDSSRMRSLKDAVLSLSSTSNAAEVRRRLIKIEKSIKLHSEPPNTIVTLEPGGKRKKPITARGMGGLGPRALPPEPPEPDEPKPAPRPGVFDSEDI